MIFLSNRTQRVLVGGKISDPVNVMSGIPQGTVLGPLLFICYINDLSNIIKSKIRIYANDTLVYNCINTIDDCIQLQRELAELEKWAKVWQMEFNPLKCELLIVRYLGVVIDSKLAWKEHIKQVLSKSNASLAFLWHNLRACSRNIKEYCYKTSIRPIIEYATNIRAPHTTQDINRIEMLQRRAARFVCNKYIQ